MIQASLETLDSRVSKEIRVNKVLQVPMALLELLGQQVIQEAKVNLDHLVLLEIKVSKGSQVIEECLEILEHKVLRVTQVPLEILAKLVPLGNLDNPVSRVRLVSPAIRVQTDRQVSLDRQEELDSLGKLVLLVHRDPLGQQEQRGLLGNLVIEAKMAILEPRVRLVTLVRLDNRVHQDFRDRKGTRVLLEPPVTLPRLDLLGNQDLLDFVALLVIQDHLEMPVLLELLEHREEMVELEQQVELVNRVLKVLLV